jgi:hypothetical protein
VIPISLKQYKPCAEFGNSVCNTHFLFVIVLLFIRGELDKAIHTTEHELKEVGKALGVYETVGAEFDCLVQEYTQLKEEITNKQWALKELK